MGEKDLPITTCSRHLSAIARPAEVHETATGRLVQRVAPLMLEIVL